MAGRFRLVTSEGGSRVAPRACWRWVNSILDLWKESSSPGWVHHGENSLVKGIDSRRSDTRLAVAVWSKRFMTLVGTS
jgi:hypothetical protein